MQTDGTNLDTARQLMGELEAGGPPGERSRRIAAWNGPAQIKAGLALANGDWELAHRLAQGMTCPVGAHWHALVHRHEGDFPNSRYWLRLAGDSPIYPLLAQAAQEEGVAELVAPGGRWDPDLFTGYFAGGGGQPWVKTLDALEIRSLLAQQVAVFAG